ncbi:hypothetical protein GCM10007036_14020 [Alsobacter metallidurans]|uniref:DUF1376 domain-containing protein n=1 Tax=Alsobacter metallidurans TaxID=340221 RepID=A0A917MJ12_9HYPH|nr:DUF1376 domain-containing protein [Alsobacter metallidurans]GGH14596.1 hypothetical protein GCM10007036_14020 [Alsobacter metallidurans]
MAALPYMPLYVADYLADAAHLTAAGHGAYLLLMMTYWQRGEPLPADDRKLARIARMTDAEWAEVRPDVAEFFREEDGRWFQPRIERELEKVRDKSEIARSAGQASAARRASKGGNARSTDDQRTSNEDQGAAQAFGGQASASVQGTDPSQSASIPPTPRSEANGNARTTSAERTLNGRSTDAQRTFNHTDTDTEKERERENAGAQALAGDAGRQKPVAITAKPAAQPDPFEAFWALYPKRPGNPRKPAAEKFAAALKRGVDPMAIVEGVRRYALSREGEDPTYTAMASTWLHQERWTVDFTPARPTTRQPAQGKPNELANAFDRLDARIAAARAGARGEDRGDHTELELRAAAG